MSQAIDEEDEQEEDDQEEYDEEDADEQVNSMCDTTNQTLNKSIKDKVEKSKKFFLSVRVFFSN